MPERVAEYRLAPEAKRDLEAIWLFTLEEWGLKQANRFGQNKEAQVIDILRIGPRGDVYKN